MSFRTARILLAFSLTAGGSGLLVAAHEQRGDHRVQASPIYNYICVGGRDVSGRTVPETCFYNPTK